MSESDHLNSTNNTGNTFISLDQASTIMADQTQGANPLHNFCSRKLEIQREGGELNWVQRVCQKFGVKKINLTLCIVP